MKEQQRELIAILEERIEVCNQRSRRFCEEGRADDGVFENIRANVYGIFKTVFAAAEKTCGGNDSARRDFFLQKIEQIPENWKISYEKAKEHGDTKKMYIESVKLETAQEIRELVEELW